MEIPRLDSRLGKANRWPIKFSGLRDAAISIGDAPWVGGTPRSPVTACLHLLTLQLNPSLLGLIVPEHLLFTPFPLLLIRVTRRGRKG